jgi:hypothetical protein
MIMSMTYEGKKETRIKKKRTEDVEPFWCKGTESRHAAGVPLVSLTATPLDVRGRRVAAAYVPDCCEICLRRYTTSSDEAASIRLANTYTG